MKNSIQLLVYVLLCIALTGCYAKQGMENPIVPSSSRSPLPSVEMTPLPTASMVPIESWTWKKIGRGNLNAFRTKEGIILYPEPITSIGLKGAGKELALGTTAYYLRAADEQFSNSEKLNITTKHLSFGTGFIVKDELFTADGMSQKMSTGELVGVAGDQSNLYITSKDGNSTKTILSNKGYDELNLKIKADKKNSGENKYILNWSSDPHPMMDGEKLAFVSNRNGVLSNHSGLSIFIVNKDGSDEKVLIDAQKYGNLTIVGTTQDLVAAENDKGFLIIGNTTSGEIKQFPINGMPIAISPNGASVLFRKVTEAAVQKDLWLLNVKNGTETIVTDFPRGYFFNTAGEWSPDGTKYAFVGNGLEVTDPTKGYRDNNLLLIIDSATSTITSYGKPEGTASIYPLGTNHWIDAAHVLVYLDDDTAWIAKVSEVIR